MEQEYIEIRGARENNLKDVSVRIPKRKITIVTGVSGSGKSSLVFDTIANESQRLLYDNFSLFVRNLLPRVALPQVTEIKNLSMAVIVDQKPLGGGSRSTVGTVTDIAAVLRLLFSRFGTPRVGNANLFSFNDPRGMCPECNGLGLRLVVDLDAAVDLSRSINDGAILLPQYDNDSYYLKLITAELFDNDTPLREFSAEDLETLLHGKAREVDLDGMKVTFEGIIDRFGRRFGNVDAKTLSDRMRKTVDQYFIMGTCPLCNGARLNEDALRCRINGNNIADLTALQADALVDVARGIDEPAARTLVDLLVERLSNLFDIGLGYLSLDRMTDTLSGGEAQRVKLVKHLNGSLVDVTYIFDEPSIGLHPQDVHRLNELLRKLRDRGNTVLVVEHDPDVVAVADHVIDVGPLAGTDGGRIVFEGPYPKLLEADTLTGRHLKDRLPIKSRFRQPTGKLSIVDAHANNLRHLDVAIPTGVFTVVTGVAGSGKSSLINQVFLRQHPHAIVVDQTPIGTSNRSNPATYTGVMDAVRKAFAATNRVDAGLFSFNSRGACPQCKGAGVVTTDLAFLGDAKIVCSVCEGRRFNEDVLAYEYRGKSIADVLDLTVAQATEFFDVKEITRRLATMSEVGLDYLTLGQPLHTLSGGECQRVKLASELHRESNVYVLDEPTTGLHVSDIARLRQLIDRVVDGSNTVITIEHNLDVIRSADWVIDLGPGAGNEGGQIMFEGTPADLRTSERARIARYL